VRRGPTGQKASQDDLADATPGLNTFVSALKIWRVETPEVLGRRRPDEIPVDQVRHLVENPVTKVTSSLSAPDAIACRRH